MAVLALAAWTQRLGAPWVACAGIGAAAWIAGGARFRRSWWGIGAAVALAVAIGLALVAQVRLAEIERDWPRIRAEVEESAAEAIGVALDDLVDRGERAVEGVARLEAALGDLEPGAAQFTRIETLRRQAAMSALVVYGRDGNPRLWAGQHRGVVPESVRRGDYEYVFHRGPLFGYLYFTRALGDGRTAVAAALLDASVPVSARHAPFAERFARHEGVAPRFLAPDRAEGGAVWDWTADRPILSVTFARVTQDAWHARTATRVRWLVCAVGLVAVLLLAFGWYRREYGHPGVPVAIVTAVLFLLPLGTMLEAQGLFSPLHFVLTAPGDLTLGRVLLLAAGGALWILIRPPSAAASARLPDGLRAALAAAAITAVIELVRRSASLALLATRPAGGLPLLFAATLMIAVPLFILIRRPRPAPGRRQVALPILGGLVLTAALAAGVVTTWRPGNAVPVWLMALWSAPFMLFYTGLRNSSGPWKALAGWLLAGWLGGSAATSYLWTKHLDARIDAAEAELGQLGTEPDPYLEYLLGQFAERAFAIAAEGETGVNLLYRSWVTSGLAREGYEARLSTWLGDQSRAELRFSDLEYGEGLVEQMLERARSAEEPILDRHTDREGLHYLLLLPLPDDRVVTVATPPRRRLGRATPLARFLHPDEPVLSGAEDDRLSLVPAMPAAPGAMLLEGDPHRVEWIPTRSGWRSETIVHFPAGAMHAHLQVTSPSAWILVVRGLLVQVLVLLAFATLWVVGRTLCGEPLGLTSGRWRWLRTFRGRLTLALFGFFLLPTLALGVVAYSAFSQQAVRTGAALALRSLELAAPDVPLQPLSVLGSRVRADLLLYHDGGLSGASAPEVMDLGLFQSWLPVDVALSFATGEELELLEEQRLAGNRYLVAYRRIGDDGVLAAPVPLASGDIGRMQREFTHGFLLMMVLGAALSVVLALFVGRALSRPIDRLSRATAAVGAGNLRVRLPEDRVDEFGGVYRAFNRMVRRLRRARASEVRTARVLAWGEMARQVAHEIKNPLTPIKLSVQHLRRAYRDGRPDFETILDRNVEAILREIDRLGQIARAFARFGAPREEAGTLVAVDLERVVDETLVLYRGGKDDIEYRVEIEPGVPRALTRDGELREVLLNLLENAREAVDGDGRITVAAAAAGGGAWVQIDVRDNGVGIAPDQLPHIFEPQFSTRSSGTGLGLAIVRRLVESWGGQIHASSEPGRGSTIHLRLRTETEEDAAEDDAPGTDAEDRPADG